MVRILEVLCLVFLGGEDLLLFLDDFLQLWVLPIALVHELDKLVLILELLFDAFLVPQGEHLSLTR